MTLTFDLVTSGSVHAESLLGTAGLLVFLPTSSRFIFTERTITHRRSVHAVKEKLITLATPAVPLASVIRTLSKVANCTNNQY